MAKLARPVARKRVKKTAKAGPASGRPKAHGRPNAHGRAKAAPRSKPAAPAKPSRSKRAAAPPPSPNPSRAAKAKPAPPADPAMDPGRKAVELFEKGFRALHQRQYDKAAEILASLVTSYPEEKELHERARVFLAVCERQAAIASAAAPRTFDERVCAATLALNRGESGRAFDLLASLEREQPDHDHVHYLLAIAHAAAGANDRALGHLRRAVELRPSNRAQAGQDVDLETLRADPAFQALVNGAQGR
ncbi:MAG: hypothetical protein H6Q10_2474 [Acidobacteria bacterium]|nr:hypothetical protein [Acidobacteriota bacterium]